MNFSTFLTKSINNIIYDNTKSDISKKYGTYDIPENWVRSEKYSTNAKEFYINENDIDNEDPSNISIYSGNNRYSKENHAKFKDAILSQIMAQMSQTDAKITGDGSTTDKGYILYTFKVEEDDALTFLHYIVGDYKYVLVQETIFDDQDEDVDNATMYIINSFEWNTK